MRNSLLILKNNFGPTTEVISIKSIEEENQSDNTDHKTKISEEKGEHDKPEKSLISGSIIKLPLFTGNFIGLVFYSF